MSDFTYKWQDQPYVPWKSYTTNSAVSSWSRPLINGPTNNIPSGPAFKARPIKHWRKQLAPREGSGISSTGIGMPMDRPGGSTYLGGNPDTCKCSNSGGNIHLIENIPRPKYLRHEKNIIKSATTILSKKYYTDSRAYLRSRNMTYEQKLSGTPANGIDYFGPDGNLLWPTTDINGPQVRAPSDCPAKCETASHTRYGSRVIYKPNNRQFGVQGAVSSSSRLERLKLNTITQNGNSFRNAFGSEGANAGKYHGTSTAPYFLKSKLEKCVSHHRTGNHTKCFPTPTGSIGQETIGQETIGQDPILGGIDEDHESVDLAEELYGYVCQDDVTCYPAICDPSDQACYTTDASCAANCPL